MPIELLYVGLAALGGLLAGLAFSYPRLARLRAELRVREAELAGRAELGAERDRLLALATERLGAAFGQLANEQFQAHSTTFLKLARESLATQQARAHGELAQRQQAIDNLIRPIQEALARTETQLLELDKARRETHGTIKAQLDAMAAGQQALSVETRNLVNALRRPEVRGQWGELTLRRLVELAGMVEHCDFVSQSYQPTEEGAVRPDMLIRLPEGRQLVVDVKTPLDAYLEAAQAETESDSRAAYARHATVLAERVRELAGKAYWRQFEHTPEFVILFIPGDQFLSAALTHRPGLLDEAMRQNIILATPTSLVALLKAVAHGWQQVALAENATQIRRLAVQLYDRLTVFAGHLAQMGKQLGDSVKSYNRAVGSLERMVLPSARRFTELGVNPRESLQSLAPVEEEPRDPSVVALAALDALEERDPANGDEEEATDAPDETTSEPDDTTESERYRG